MKISLSGGSKSIKKTVTVTEDGVLAETIPEKKINNAKKSTIVETAPKKKEPKIIEEPKEENKVEKIEKPKQEKKVEEVKAPVSTMAVNGVKTTKEPEKPAPVQAIKFVTEEEQMKTMEKILEHINEIRSLSGLLTDEESFDLSDIFLDLYVEFENRPSAKKVDLHTFLTCVEKAALLVGKFTEEDKKVAFTNEFVKDLVDDYNDINEIDINEDDDEDVEDDYIDEIKGFCTVNGSIKNLKDIDSEKPSKKIIVLADDNDNYIMSASGDILVIDNLDNRSMDSVALVSKEWLTNTQKILETRENEENMADDDEDAIIDNVNGEEVE